MRFTEYCMITQAYPPAVGGVERHVSSVHRALGHAGHRGTVLVVSGGRVHTSDPAVHWIPAGRLANIPFTSRARATFHLLSALPKSHTCAIHVHDVNALTVAFPALAIRRALSRTFLTIHGWDGRYPPQAAMIRRLLHAERTVRGTLCVGTFIRKWYGLSDGPVTYGGVDEFATPPPVELSRRPLDVGYVGRLEPDTGVLELARAFTHVWRDARGSLRLVVRGAGSLRPALDELARDAPGAILFREPSATLDVLYEPPIIFASGYLTIAEALRARRVVLAYFSNPIRRDYLQLHPAAAALRVCGSIDDVVHHLVACLKGDPEIIPAAARGWAWAEAQTWDSVARDYTSLWEHS